MPMPEMSVNLFRIKHFALRVHVFLIGARKCNVVDIFFYVNFIGD